MIPNAALHALPFDAETRADIARRGQLVHLVAGAPAFRTGDTAQAYLMVLSGTVRIQLVAESGREIVLYRITRGESCVLTTSCLFRNEPYAAEAVSETPVEALALPAAVFRDLLARSESFREAVLTDYAQRILDILMLMDLSASQSVSTRLARLIRERAGPDGLLTATHYDLAVELGTAREVVSRTLKDFERQGAVALGRGHLSIASRAILGRLASD